MSTASQVGSRATRPGSSRARAAGAALAAAVVVVVGILVLSGGSGSSGSGGQPAGSLVARGATHSGERATVAHIGRNTYGYIPAWLPRTKVPVGRVVTASASHPRLAIQGDTVRVDLTHGRVLATAAGPNVPEEGHFPIPKVTRCTFTITFTSASGVIPLTRSSFASIDEEGRVHALRVWRIGGGPIPTRVAPGHTVSLTMEAMLPTGEGRLLWAPQAGRPLVQWDFDVEID